MINMAYSRGDKMKRYRMNKWIIVLIDLIVITIFFGLYMVTFLVRDNSSVIYLLIVIIFSLLFMVYTWFLTRSYVEVGNESIRIYSGFGETGYLVLLYSELRSIEYETIFKTLILRRFNNSTVYITLFYKDSQELINDIFNSIVESKTELKMDRKCLEILENARMTKL
jgi:hypothetical protein